MTARNVLLPALWIFFALFLFYPLLYVVQGAFWVPDGEGGYFSLELFALLFSNQLYLNSFLNSLAIAGLTTLFSLLLALPLSVAFLRLEFPGKRVLQALMLVPLILPPFVGAIGIQHFFSRFGTVNLILANLGWIDLQNPVDWFGNSGLYGVVLVETLHSFPILFLTLSAALANVDPSLRAAAANLGASGWRVFRTVSLPLALPGVVAGGALIFVNAFTDLGTPLIFNFQETVPTQIFNAAGESGINPIGYALVLTTLAGVVVFFVLTRILGEAGTYAMLGRASSEDQARPLRAGLGWLVSLGVTALLALALLPHFGVAINSVAERWFMTPWPEEVTLRFYGEVFQDDFTMLIIRNSLFYASLSAVLDLILGVAIAHLLAREKFFGKAALDAVAMLPLALPGLVLAFGFVMSFNFQEEGAWGWLAWINPRNDPTFLLVVSYAVRRLPYIVRAAYAGYQQTSVVLEEASYNLGAGFWTTLRRITVPLIAANLIAGTILTFCFAMLEVSDSLILAMETRFAPITRGIYDLMGRPDPQAAMLACALGVLAMLLLGGALFLASRLLGRSLGSLFRV